MSILRAMYSGVSGINAESSALGVVGDNVANVNTVGFKGSRIQFSDVLGQFTGGTPVAGAGVRVLSVEQLFTQGSLSTTGVSTDIALNGAGFFVVRGNLDGTTGTFYTRAGNFHPDDKGFLETTEGLRLQGYAMMPNGLFSSDVTDVNVPANEIAPKKTSNLGLVANLNSNELVQDPPFDLQNPDATSSFQTSSVVYDTLGNSHVVNIYFYKTGENQWSYTAAVDGKDVVGGTEGERVSLGEGTLEFTDSGALKTTTGMSLSANFAGTSNTQTIDLSFGEETDPSRAGIKPGGGLNGITQYASQSNWLSQSQDGYAPGSLVGISFDSQGVVLGTYTNGEKIPIAQVAVAMFRSDNGLLRAGHSVWAESAASGRPILGTAGAAGRGGVVGGTLEMSNVDLAQQFVDMITHQRAFQANSKTVTTADEMLVDLVNLKR